ncbi:ATP-binding cassette domain-containing protein [Aquincola sp. S2]|uniref:ATP-binding cassette domain-containing protein n=1 Tax=Pseudaquabacterium terrae TaxID=2732868 RepID=A0ABX2EPZ4_9BURK|nr:ATP-binding cassette domain-containing protein [Aquabacterium terrae]NRF70730.1 ATP-binding cassette domain-containing protein [Aquabacterium terrae]
MTILLALDDVGVRYGEVRALQGAALQIHRGDFVALIGANGSGKTTLLQVLHGLVPHSGIRTVSPLGAAQTMVFQRPFMLRMSVWNNMRLALWLAGVPAAQRPARAEQALDRAGLRGVRARPARTLSGGQQQRLALARAWALKPDVLFLDEPTANLDPSGKKEVEAMLAGFAADGMTLVMSTHNLGQAKRLATRVVYLDRGIIRADLPTTHFFQDSLDDRTELFLKGDLKWEV